LHEHFDAQRAFTHTDELAKLRRLAGTPGETEAQEYIKTAGVETGVEMQEEEFAYSELPLKFALPAMCVAIGAVSAMGSLAYLWRTTLVIVPGIALLAVVYIGFKWSSVFERFASRGSRRSKNLIGEIGGREPTGTILLGAHYDSKSQLMPVVVRASCFMLGFAAAILFGLTLVVTGILTAAGVECLGSLTGFYVSLAVPVLMLALVFNATGNVSPGALDDAAGVGIILEMGRVLALSPLENFDVRVAAFGCEEIGLCGSISYLLAHEDDLRLKPFYMLNFDTPFTASGNLMLNTGFELPPVRTSRHLNDLTRVASEKMGLRMSGAFLPVGAGADHMPWVKHGFEATCFVSAGPTIHSSRDSIDKVNREGLRRVGEVAVAVLRELDQEASSRSKNPGSQEEEDS